MEPDDISDMCCDLFDVIQVLKHHPIDEEIMLSNYPDSIGKSKLEKRGTLLDLPKGDGGIFTIGELLESVLFTLETSQGETGE